MYRSLLGRMVFRIIWLLNVGILLGGCLPQAPLIQNQDIAVFGPVRIKFSSPMNKTSVDERFSIYADDAGGNEQAKLQGRIKWVDNELIYSPHLSFQTGCSYNLHIAPGFQDEVGNITLSPTIIKIRARQPSIVFMSPANENAQLWRISISGNDAFQLTHQSFGIYDFAVSHDGNWIVYSATNENGGRDIWKVDRDGIEETLLVFCGTDWCIQPAISVDSEKVAYSKFNKQSGLKMNNNDQGSQAVGSHVWLFSLVSGTNEQLTNINNKNEYETMPSWSPDGNRLAYFIKNDDNRGIKIMDLGAEAADLFIPSSMEATGSWSDDGSSLLYMDMQLTSRSRPIYVLYEVNLITREIRQILNQSLAGLDFNLPVYTHDKQWVLLSEQIIEGAFNKQLILRNLSGDQLIKITNDFQYNNAAYKWEPGGNGLIFQRYSNSSSDAVPQVVLWTSYETNNNNCGDNNKEDIDLIMQNDIFRILAADAAMPAWLP